MDLLRIVILSLVSAVFLFLLAKLMGNKEISQLNMFDYVTGITIGSIAAEMATGLDKNALHPSIAMAVYALLAVGISFLANKSLSARKIITGRPILLMDNGKIFRSNLAKARMDVSDFMMMCRSQGCFDIGQIQTAILEFNGNLSILFKSANRPATPQDLNVSPMQEHVLTTVIMDGKLLKDNLKILNHNEKWLEKQIKAQGYKKMEDIFLATCDDNGNVSIYPMEKTKVAIDWFE